MTVRSRNHQKNNKWTFVNVSNENTIEHIYLFMKSTELSKNIYIDNMYFNVNLYYNQLRNGSRKKRKDSKNQISVTNQYSEFVL